MRRENRRDIREGGFDTKKALYLSGSILAVAIIGFVVTFFVYGSGLEKDTTLGQFEIGDRTEYMQNTEAASSEFGKTVNEMQGLEANEVNNTTKYAVNTSTVEANVIGGNSKTTAKDTDKKTTKTNTDPKKDTTKKDAKVADPKFQKPVSGEIVKEFAKDKLVYSNTLGEWITHNGVDIKANKTTVVKASAEGTVKSIKNDPRYGLTVVIEHANGFTSVYANLLTAEFVVEGEKIKQGQTVGTVGTTATFEISDEPHLHFEILKDGENVDPELYIKD